MAIEISSEKRAVLQALVKWFRNRELPFITVGGYAGTGKTLVLAQFRLVLAKMSPNLRVAFCAYTGKAARVLSHSLTNQGSTFPQDSCSTIHSLIYAPATNSNGQITAWKKKQKLAADLIVVDEASMVDRKIWTDLTSFGIPILAAGDHGQLPPIDAAFNLMEQPELVLSTIYRQAVDNPIIGLSIMAREQGVIPIGKYGQGVIKLSRYEIETGQVVEDLLLSAKKDLLILTGLNATRVKLNQTMRMYLGIESDEPVSGDKVICLQNRWEAGIYNGMTGVIKAIKKTHFGIEDQRGYDVEIEMEEGEVQYAGTIAAKPFNHLQSSSTELEVPLNIGLFDFGYALTVHKAQGSQAKRVLLFEERNKYMSDDDWRRWLYTGITRAEEQLTIVGI